MSTAPSRRNLGGAPSALTPKVVYGWRDVPPVGHPWADVSRTPRDALGGVDFVCTTRSIDSASGRWVCTEYTVIRERGTLIVEPSDPNATHAQPAS
jgi:hypothetical protein